MQFQVNLTAGVVWRQQTAGAFFVLMSTGVASSVDVRFVDHAHELEHITTASRGLKARMPAGRKFNAVEFLSTVPCTLSFIISDGAIDVDIIDGATVTIGNTGANPVPVSNDRGSPGNPVYVNTALAGLPAAVAIADDAAIPVTAALTACVAANANRIRVIFTNQDPTNPVAIGGAGLTWAKRAIVLQPGDTWVEERGANLAWSAICNAGQTATVGVQEVTA